MILLAFAVHDSKVGVFNAPFFQRTKGEAIRGFTDAKNDPQSMLNKHPSDYSLWLLGEWNDADGLFTSGKPLRIIGADELG